MMPHRQQGWRLPIPLSFFPGDPVPKDRKGNRKKKKAAAEGVGAVVGAKMGEKKIPGSDWGDTVLPNWQKEEES